MAALYRLFCEPCGFSRFTDGTDCGDLQPMKISAVPGGYPAMNPATKVVEDRKVFKRGKWFKCPKCGRAIVSKKIDKPKIENQPDPGPPDIDLEFPDGK